MIYWVARIDFERLELDWATAVENEEEDKNKPTPRPADQLHRPLSLFSGRQAPSGATFYLFSWRAECEGLSAALGRLRHVARPEHPSLHLLHGLQPACACRGAVFAAVRRQRRGVLRSAEALRNARA